MVCSDVAGSEVARCLLLDVENVRRLYVFLASELSVPPFRLKLLLPGGRFLHRIGTTWYQLEGLMCGKLLRPISDVAWPPWGAGSTRDEQDGSSSDSGESETSNMHEEDSRQPQV